jgi:hypothetical protein
MLKFTQTGNLQEGIEKDLASKYYSLRIKHLKEIDYSKDLKKTHSNFVQKSRWSWICFPKKSFFLNYKMLNEVERKINSKKKILKIPNSVSKDWLSYSKNTRRKSIRRQCQEWILGYFLQKKYKLRKLRLTVSFAHLENNKIKFRCFWVSFPNGQNSLLIFVSRGSGIETFLQSISCKIIRRLCFMPYWIRE